MANAQLEEFANAVSETGTKSKTDTQITSTRETKTDTQNTSTRETKTDRPETSTDTSTHRTGAGRGGDRAGRGGDRSGRGGDRAGRGGDRAGRGDRDDRRGDGVHRRGDREDRHGDREDRRGDREDRHGDREDRRGDRHGERSGRGGGERSGRGGERSGRGGERSGRGGERSGRVPRVYEGPVLSTDGSLPSLDELRQGAQPKLDRVLEQRAERRREWSQGAQDGYAEFLQHLKEANEVLTPFLTSQLVGLVAKMLETSKKEFHWQYLDSIPDTGLDLKGLSANTVIGGRFDRQRSRHDAMSRVEAGLPLDFWKDIDKKLIGKGYRVTDITDPSKGRRKFVLVTLD